MFLRRPIGANNWGGCVDSKTSKLVYMVSKIIDLLVLPVMRGKNVLELINEDT